MSCAPSSRRCKAPAINSPPKPSNRSRALSRSIPPNAIRRSECPWCGISSSEQWPGTRSLAAGANLTKEQLSTLEAEDLPAGESSTSCPRSHQQNRHAHVTSGEPAPLLNGFRVLSITLTLSALAGWKAHALTTQQLNRRVQSLRAVRRALPRRNVLLQQARSGHVRITGRGGLA